jgi:hypothetical protein
MINFLEALVTLLPADAGGRTSSIAPRDGSYRPFAVSSGGERLRIRIIEGPPTIAPGQDGNVVVELETPVTAYLSAGMELDLMEHDRCVGILTVTRFCRAVQA